MKSTELRPDTVLIVIIRTKCPNHCTQRRENRSEADSVRQGDIEEGNQFETREARADSEDNIEVTTKGLLERRGANKNGYRRVRGT